MWCIMVQCQAMVNTNEQSQYKQLVEFHEYCYICILRTVDRLMEFVISNDFDGCNGVKLQKKLSLKMF